MTVRPSAPRRASLYEVMKAVLWSFLGIRRRAEHERDAVSLTPVQVIVAGLAAAAVFILVLVLIVRLVLSSAG